MTELKVVSKKYNDKDELLVENFDSEVKKLVDEKALSVGVVAKTLEQTEANWEYPENKITFPTLATGLQLDVPFIRFQQLNASLHIIFLLKITNTTDAQINVGSPRLTFPKEYIPVEIQKSIIGFNGVSLYDMIGNHQFIAHIPTIRGDVSSDQSLDINSTSFLQVLLDMATDKLMINIGGVGQLPAGKSRVVEGRVELDLI